MDKKILGFDTYCAAVDAVAALIKDREVDLSVKHIVLVPEQYTLFTERRLLSGCNGFFDVEVYSLSRWYYKLGGGVCLPSEGAVMMLRDILENAELKCFNRSKGFRGFCERLYETLYGFYSCGVTPDDLLKRSDSAALELKLGDIATVYAEFLKRIEGIPLDRAGRAAALKEKLDKPAALDNVRIYKVNFGLTVRAEDELFDVIAQRALSFTEAVCTGEGKITAKTEIYAASSNADALKSAARRIRDAAMRGVKYSDMCIVGAQGSFERARRIMGEYGIPFYVDNRIKLIQHPLPRLIVTLSALKRLSRADFIELSKNPYAGVGFDEADIFENYCNRFLIDYTAFTRPFELIDRRADRDGEIDRLKRAEAVRRRLYSLVCAYNDAVKSAQTAAGFAAALDAFIDKTEGSAQDDGLARNKLKGLLSLMSSAVTSPKVLSGKELNFLTALLLEGMAAEDLKGLPRTADCVVIADASAFRGARFKYAFVLDFNEGVLPPAVASSGVITDAEAQTLKNAGLKLPPSDEQRAAQAEKDLRQLMAASDRLFLCYTKTAEMRPSVMLSDIISQKNITPDSFDAQERRLKTASADTLAFYAGSLAGGLERLLLTASAPDGFTAALYEAVGARAHGFMNGGDMHGPVDSRVFFGGGTVSASQLQTYFDCPYKHFVKYGLRARPPEKGSPDATDAGSVIHKAAEGFAVSGFDERKLDGIIEDAFDFYKYELGQNEQYRLKLKEEIKKLCLVFKSHLKAGEFSPVAAELRFGHDGVLKTLEFDGVRLTGSVDYADAWQGYARVIDYKSGYVSFDATSLYYGVKLQLPLYMRVLMENNYKPAAMLYFPFKAKWERDDYRFIGVFDRDRRVVDAVDRGFAEGGESRVIAATLTATKAGEKIGGRGARDADELLAYCAYAHNVSLTAVRQLKDGNAVPAPYKSGKYDSCRYCAFKPSCGFSAAPRRFSRAEISCTGEVSHD